MSLPPTSSLLRSCPRLASSLLRRPPLPAGSTSSLCAPLTAPVRPPLPTPPGTCRKHSSFSAPTPPSAQSASPLLSDGLLSDGTLSTPSSLFAPVFGDAPGPLSRHAAPPSPSSPPPPADSYSRYSSPLPTPATPPAPHHPDFTPPLSSEPSLRGLSLKDLQLHTELLQLSAAASEYEALREATERRGGQAQLRPVTRQFVRWFPLLQAEFARAQRSFLAPPPGGRAPPDSSNYGPVLLLVKPAKLAVIAMHVAVSEIVGARDSALEHAFTSVCMAVGDAVRAEVGAQRVLHERTGGGKYKDKRMTEL